MNKRLLQLGAAISLSRPIAPLLAWRKRRGQGAALDTQIAAMLATADLIHLPTMDSMDPDGARRFSANEISVLDFAPTAMASLQDFTVPGPAGPIPVRTYHPYGAGKHWIVYFHGGGGVVGSIAGHDAAVRYLADRTSCTVASVEYRLGPEHKHPAAILDSVAAYRAVLARVPAAGKIAVAGDSFGGFLATHVDHAQWNTSHAATGTGRQPDLQVLLYPIVDLTLTSASIERLAAGYVLTKPLVHWFRDHYLHTTDDQRAGSPLYWPDLGKACPAIVAVAGYDPLVDEGDTYADHLGAAGVTVRHRRYPGLIHGFLNVAGRIRAARGAVDEVCADVRAMLG